MMDLWLLAGIIALLGQALDVLLGYIAAGRENVEPANGGGYAVDVPFEH